MALLQIYLTHKANLERAIQELYEDQLLAGIGVIGDYILKLRGLERQLRDINQKIGDEARKEIPEISVIDGPLKIIKLFLASSSELQVEREQIEIFINRENNNLINKKVFIRLIVWEDFIDAMSQTRLQQEYNNIIKECDIFLSLFFTKVGIYTEEEFDVAFSTFQNNSRPFIYTYFKGTENGNDPLQRVSLETFKHKLRKLGHYPTIFNNIYDLKYQFKMQLEKLLQSSYQ